MTDQETITIPKKRYRELLEAEKTLYKLEAMGVDNWEGYSEALGYDEDEEEDDE